MKPTGKGKKRDHGDNSIFANFVNICWWFWERVVWPFWTSIGAWSTSFFPWYLKTSSFPLEFFFYLVLETCLICSPIMNRNNEQKNFIRFGSSSVCLFSYHQCFYTYETFEHYAPIVKVFLSHCRSFLSNWDSLYVRLNSHYKAWSYKKRKDKKIKAYSESL